MNIYYFFGDSGGTEGEEEKRLLLTVGVSPRYGSTVSGCAAAERAEGIDEEEEALRHMSASALCTLTGTGCGEISSGRNAFS